MFNGLDKFDLLIEIDFILKEESLICFLYPFLIQNKIKSVELYFLQSSP